jgi:hypothetical protein
MSQATRAAHAQEDEDIRFDSLGDLLDAIDARSDREDGVTLDTVQDMAGRSAFGPMILLPGLVALSPLSGIPTLPTILGTIVILIAAQLVIGRHEVWLPQRLLRARLSRERVDKGMRFLKPVARAVDKVIKPRLAFATKDFAQRGAALMCILVAMTMPPLELLPFMATSAGLILSIFGLAITVRDGVLMLFALALTLAGAGGLAYWFFF